MKPSDAAVEAAAKASYEVLASVWRWLDLSDSEKNMRRQRARAAVEAAYRVDAPRSEATVKAEALLEAGDWLCDSVSDDRDPVHSMGGVAARLRERAEEFDPTLLNGETNA